MAPNANALLARGGYLCLPSAPEEKLCGDTPFFRVLAVLLPVEAHFEHGRIDRLLAAGGALVLALWAAGSEPLIFGQSHRLSSPTHDCVEE